MQKLQNERINAVREFNSEVKKNKFPSKKNLITIDKKELMNFKKYLTKQNLKN